MHRARLAVAVASVLFVGLAWPNRASTTGEVAVLTSFPKELFETFKREFEARHPDVTVVVKSKPTSAIVAYVQETGERPDSDLVWASATDAFAFLKAGGFLAKHALPNDIARPIPVSVGPYPVHDPDGHYFGFALSGYGVMWNVPYLEAYGLKPPGEWTDLTDPMYHGHLSMSAPSHSGTTHLMVESILQGYGWQRGWATLMNLCGNMATITERSFGVPQGVNNGEFGIGMVIDFFALSAMASGYPVGFAYPSATPITPASIGLVERGPNPEAATQFIRFLLGVEGQKLLFRPEISRLPVIPDLYLEAPEGFPNPFKMEMSGATFDLGVSERRYGLINSLFDQVVTFRLGLLKEAWGAIYEAESQAREAGKDGRDAERSWDLIAEARRLAGTVPLSEQQANDPEFCAHFGKRSSAEQARYETEWDAVTKANYSRASRLAREAME